jgi:hypothetical protein
MSSSAAASAAASEADVDDNSVSEVASSAAGADDDGPARPGPTKGRKAKAGKAKKNSKAAPTARSPKKDPAPAKDPAEKLRAAPPPPSPSKRVEDVLPDLVPLRNGRQPSRRSTEAEKCAAIIEHVVEMDKHFCCFTCLKYFANFHQVTISISILI